MNEIQLNGTIFFEPSTNQWTGSGTGWWIEKTDNHMAKITFEEPITFDPRNISTKSYSLTISNINKNGEIHTHHVDQNGFIITWEGYSNETCIASFQVVGTKACFIPNDRNLGTQENVADIYASELLFSYEAKYGVITLMGSGTISCREIAEEKFRYFTPAFCRIEGGLGEGK